MSINVYGFIWKAEIWPRAEHSKQYCRCISTYAAPVAGHDNWSMSGPPRRRTHKVKSNGKTYYKYVGWMCMWKMVILGPPDQCLTYKPHDWFPPVASLLNWRTIISIKRQIFRYDKLNIFMVNYFHRGWQVKLMSIAISPQFLYWSENYSTCKLNLPSSCQYI